MTDPLYDITGIKLAEVEKPTQKKGRDPLPNPLLDLVKTRKLMLAYGVLVSEGKSFRRFQDKVNSGVEIAQAAGLAKVGDTLVVTAGEGVPGSTNACKTAWINILSLQLDNQHRPCNFVPNLKKSAACESRN